MDHRLTLSEPDVHERVAAWRTATVAVLPMCLKACPRPTVVVVFPSPAGVGVIAVTLMSFASGCMDILSYRRLGQVFTSAMTGNAALLGLGIGQGNLGAMSRISARRGKEPGTDWLSRMLGRKPVKLVAVALANRMARVAWALMAKTEVYRAEAAAA